MKTSLITAALMIALAVVNTCKGEAKATHIVLIEHGYVTVCESNGHSLGYIKIADMAKVDQRPMPKTRHDLRHFALNAAAAFIAGGGNRNNSTVDSSIRVTTIDESKGPSSELYPSVT